MIRPYRPADCEAVLRVWFQASVVAHPFLSREFLETERQTIRTVHLTRADTWVWEADGRVAGFVSLLGNEVGGIFVEPACHRTGIGRALIDHARTLRGVLEVEVFERNLLGRAFYAGLGFEPVHRAVDPQTSLEVIRLRLAAETPPYRNYGPARPYQDVPDPDGPDPYEGATDDAAGNT